MKLFWRILNATIIEAIKICVFLNCYDLVVGDKIEIADKSWFTIKN